MRYEIMLVLDWGKIVLCLWCMIWGCDVFVIFVDVFCGYLVFFCIFVMVFCGNVNFFVGVEEVFGKEGVVGWIVVVEESFVFVVDNEVGDIYFIFDMMFVGC